MIQLFKHNVSLMLRLQENDAIKGRPQNFDIDQYKGSYDIMVVLSYHFFV